MGGQPRQHVTVSIPVHIALTRPFFLPLKTTGANLDHAIISQEELAVAKSTYGQGFQLKPSHFKADMEASGAAYKDKHLWLFLCGVDGGCPVHVRLDRLCVGSVG